MQASSFQPSSNFLLHSEESCIMMYLYFKLFYPYLPRYSLGGPILWNMYLETYDVRSLTSSPVSVSDRSDVVGLFKAGWWTMSSWYNLTLAGLSITGNDFTFTVVISSLPFPPAPFCLPTRSIWRQCLQWCSDCWPDKRRPSTYRGDLHYDRTRPVGACI